MTLSESKLDTVLTVATANIANTSCSSTWLYPDSTNENICECGNSVGHTVECNNVTKKVKLAYCYCMTFDNNEETVVTGGCLYSCATHHYYHIPPNRSDLNNQSVCERNNREGQLCGKCQDGFAPPVYSYSLSCVNCTDYHNNWLKYAAISFLPLTGFYFVITAFRISATSVWMNVFILSNQAVTTPTVMRLLALKRSFIVNIDVVASLYGIWNLDFFRLLYSPFCLHPHMTLLQTVALDYLIAIYPLVLIVASYILVELHDHNCRIVVWLWKPFHRCFVRFRKEWNIRASLIDAFATFLLLSYVKFLSVSFDLLKPVRLYNIHGKVVGLYVYYSGSVKYFGKEHLPYAILALGVVLTFNVFPVLLLCLYPRRCFQNRLTHCRLKCLALHAFMDSFQGCYKNGTSGTRDCRWFSIVYLVIRIAFLVLITVRITNFWLPIIAVMILVILILIVVIQPYKTRNDNTIETLLLSFLILVSLSISSDFIVHKKPDFDLEGVSAAMIGASFLMSLIYILGLILYKLLSNKRWAQFICRNIQNCICKEVTRVDLEESLPDRLAHPEQYSSLLTEPGEHSDEESDSSTSVSTEQTY